MKERHAEVSDVFSYSYEEANEKYNFSPRQQIVASHIMNCRTAEMGAYVYQCEECGHEYITYCSCRDRMCPKCQSDAHHKWIEKMMKIVLDCIHLHVVVTVPECLNRIALANKELFYSLLFEVAVSAVLTLCRDRKYLGATPGITAILHTWGQKLTFHPHIHLAVTAGGLTDDGKWKNAKRTKKGDVYLIPVKALARIVKKQMFKKLRESKKKGLLIFDDTEFEKILKEADTKEWISYCKEPFKGSGGVFAYIGNYTHRSAIANSRIRSVSKDKVTFQYRDYADGNKQKLLTLSNIEFIRLVLQHVLAKGFVRIRHYGLYAVPNRKKRLKAAREQLSVEKQQKPPAEKEEVRKTEEEALPFVYRCPCCGGIMYRRNSSPLTKEALITLMAAKLVEPLPP